MGRKYLVEEIDFEDDILITIFAPIIGIGILLLVNWSFFKSLMNTDSDVIGIWIGIGLSLLISCCIFIIKIKDGLSELFEFTFKCTFWLCFVLMLLGSIVAPMVEYYITYKSIDFILWDFLKALFFGAIILIISAPLVSLLVTVLATIIGFLLSFPIYKVIYMIKSRRIRKTDCWEELKSVFGRIDFKNNVIKFNLYQNKIEFELNDNHEVKVFYFDKRGYNNLKKLQQLTFINMIKKETKTPIKIEINSYASIYTGYNKFLLKQQKEKEEKYYRTLIKERNLDRKIERDLRKKKRKKYKEERKAGKNW